MEIENEIKKEVETLHREEAKLFRKWAPEMTIITVVAVILVLGVVAYSGMAINDLKGQMSFYGDGANGSQWVFACGANAKLSLQISPMCGAASCQEDGKVKIYAFHSPSCTYCEKQTLILNELKQKYGNKLDLSYVCTVLHEGDEELCKTNAGNKYLPFEQSDVLSKQYVPMIAKVEANWGTPVLIVNCEFARIGTYAVMDEKEGTTREKTDLTGLFDLLLAK